MLIFVRNVTKLLAIQVVRGYFEFTNIVVVHNSKLSSVVLEDEAEGTFVVQGFSYSSLNLTNG